MLKDPKAKALVENFRAVVATRSLKSATPDRSLFKTFNESLDRPYKRKPSVLEAIVRKIAAF